MNKSLLSSCFVLFTLQFPRVGLGKGLRKLLSLSGAVSSMSFTESLFWSSMEMRDNSHNFHHFHLQPHYLILTCLNEHYFLTLIPSLKKKPCTTLSSSFLPLFWNPPPVSQWSATSRIWVRSHRGKIKRFRLLVVFQPPFWSGRGE